MERSRDCPIYLWLQQRRRRTVGIPKSKGEEMTTTYIGQVGIIAARSERSKRRFNAPSLPLSLSLFPSLLNFDARSCRGCVPC